ncbi:HAD-IA family hydrolase [Streptomyces sp. JH14]|uniref:HAD family hydrolase n=1 Tax=Streptomyces sp. JH14 TaxID=2793630 RepID=UPI0023F65515|nr:HAD-IA family hydrolase [Streptomyces sp. JH14]MDF6040689.1 HAD-IA family hydrolase [Streptomyces sp. JH14]
MIQAVLLDLDATLLDYGMPAWRATVRDVCATLGEQAPDLDGDALYGAYVRRYLDHMRAAGDGAPHPPGRIPDAGSLWREFWRQALDECGHAELAGPATDEYTRQRRLRYALFDDVTDTLSALRSASCRLVLVTNGPGDAQRDKITATGLDEFLDLTVISGEVAVSMPDRRIFDITLDRLGLGAADVCHVGDSLVTDVGGAHNAGLGASIWLNRSRVERDPRLRPPSHEITSLRELPALVRAGSAV